jgi:hypothetical protein
MNESLLEYIRLREQMFKLYQRQGPEAWNIIQRVIQDLDISTRHWQDSAKS